MNQDFRLPSFTMSDYNDYRLDDWIFWAFVLAGLAFCLVHAARRAYRQPAPTASPEISAPQTTAEEDEIRRHTLFQRIYHWSNAIAILILVISGWMIYQTPGSPESAAAGPFAWHRWGVAFLLVGILFHLIYESFIARDPNPMVFNFSEIRKILAIFKNFFGVSKFYPMAGKYHPGQIFFHWTVAANILALILTGFVLWKPFRDLLPLPFFGLGWNFIFYCRLLHGLFAATLIASLMGHIYFALFIKKNWTETQSMVTGRIPAREYFQTHLPPE